MSIDIASLSKLKFQDYVSTFSLFSEKDINQIIDYLIHDSELSEKDSEEMMRILCLCSFESPKNITHKTFYSHILSHEIGYNIYLPSDYWESEERYPVAYHIHGWQGNESSEIWSIEKVCNNRQAITVFMNAISLENEYIDALLGVSQIKLTKLNLALVILPIVGKKPKRIEFNFVIP